VGPPTTEREFFIDNLQVRIHVIIVMIRWTGLAPWEFEFPFPGSLASTFLDRGYSAPDQNHQTRGIPRAFRSAECTGRTWLGRRRALNGGVNSPSFLFLLLFSRCRS